MEIVAVVGRSGAGKTHLIERMLPVLCSSGLDVATLKHTHHRVARDREGADTFRHRQAGAHRAVLAGPGFCTVFTENEVPLGELVRMAGLGVDLLLIEGFKSVKELRKIEVVRGLPPLLEPAEVWMTVTAEESDRVAEAIVALLRSFS